MNYVLKTDNVTISHIPSALSKQKTKNYFNLIFKHPETGLSAPCQPISKNICCKARHMCLQTMEKYQSKVACFKWSTCGLKGPCLFIHCCRMSHASFRSSKACPWAHSLSPLVKTAGVSYIKPLPLAVLGPINNWAENSKVDKIREKDLQVKIKLQS